MSKATQPQEQESKSIDEGTRESLEFVRENYDGVVSEVADMLLHPSEEARD